MSGIIKKILISSSDFILKNKYNADKTKSDMPDLKEGQIVEAKIIKIISPREALLDIQGKKVSANTYTQLQEGEKAQFKVINAENQNQKILKLVQIIGKDSINSEFGMLKTLVKAEPYENIFNLLKKTSKPITNLVNLLKNISLKSEKVDLKFLNSLIQGSGLDWENKLFSFLNSNPSNDLNKNEIQNLINNDLKAISMERVLNPVDKENMEHETLNTFKNFVQDIEKLQLLNKSSLEETGKILIPLPIDFGEFFKFGQILIDLGEKKSEEKEKENNLIKIAFLLELSNLGHIQADFSIFKKAINGIFEVPNEDIKNLIEEYMPQLYENLNRHGFEVHNIKCKIVSFESLSSASLIDKMIDTEEGLLNLVI